jgi:predicted nucleotidyltransferase
MITNKDDIIQLLLLNKGLIRSFNVQRIGIFGSLISGANTEESDVDLLVEFEEGKKTFKNYTGAYLFLKDILKSEIDFLTPESLSPYIGPSILNSIEYVSFSS